MFTLWPFICYWHDTLECDRLHERLECRYDLHSLASCIHGPLDVLMQKAECRMQNAESIKTSIIIQVEIVRALLVDSINFYDGIIDSQVNYNLVDFNIFTSVEWNTRRWYSTFNDYDHLKTSIPMAKTFLENVYIVLI